VSSAVRVIGFGMGPQHITPEAAEALRSCDYVVAASKGAADPLLAVRRTICEAYGVELVAVADPERDRMDPTDYAGAVRDWHDARVEAYRAVVGARGGTAGFLVWGDPSLYDSTIRIVAQLGDYDVVPGISAPQLLAARHRMVLHDVGAPVHVTTGRRLPDDIAAGQTNLVVMLPSEATLGLLADLADWSIWWGANLGAPSEQLVAGRAGDVHDAIRTARTAAKAEAGWVMDLWLLRAPTR
jgi:precorrin-6A synthase